MITRTTVTIILFGFLVNWTPVECTQLTKIARKIFTVVFSPDQPGHRETLEICEQARNLVPEGEKEAKMRDVMIELVRLCRGEMELCEDMDTFKRLRQKFSREASPALDCLRHCEESMEQRCSEDFQLRTDTAINSLQAKPDEYLQVMAFKDIMFESGQSPGVKQIAVGTARFLMKLRNFAPMSADRDVFFNEFERHVIPVCNNIISVLTDHEEFKAKKHYLNVPDASLWYQLRENCERLLSNRHAILARVHSHAPKVRRF